MASLGDRIRELRKSTGETQRAFAGRLGTKYQYLSKLERSEILPGAKILARLAMMCKVDLNWLVTGEGKAPDSSRVKEALATYSATHPPIPPLAIVTRQEVRDRFRELESPENYAVVPLYSDAVAAGDGAFVEEEVESFSIIYSSWVRGPGPHTSIRIKGKSMEPVLPDGSIVGIDHSQRDPEKLLNKIVVARNKDGALTVKYLKRAGDFWILQPATSQFDIIIMKKDELEIIGKVSWYWGRPK